MNDCAPALTSISQNYPPLLEHHFSTLNGYPSTLNGKPPTSNNYPPILEPLNSYAPALNDSSVFLSISDDYPPISDPHPSAFNGYPPTYDHLTISNPFPSTSNGCPSTSNKCPPILEPLLTLKDCVPASSDYTSTSSGHLSTSDDHTPILNPYPSTLSASPPVINAYPLTSNAYAYPSQTLPVDYAYSGNEHRGLCPIAYGQYSAADSNGGTDPPPVLLYSQTAPRPPTPILNDSCRCRPLFTYEPLDTQRSRSSILSPTARPKLRHSDLQPWEWVSSAMALKVERFLGIPLRKLSMPMLEGPGCIYCFQIDKPSKFLNTGFFKVGRMTNIEKREIQWRRQCHSQRQEWYDPINVDHCHLIERLVHLKLQQICVAWPRDACNDCLKKHREIYELELIGRYTVARKIVPLIKEVAILVSEAIRFK
ncbi:hypothetical protein PM082_012151 [Marasmius tenuissimus]|nr:hypothetical protein PM082_012151 [Marasmius tenuissimus]